MEAFARCQGVWGAYGVGVVPGGRVNLCYWFVPKPLADDGALDVLGFGSRIPAVWVQRAGVAVARDELSPGMTRSLGLFLSHSTGPWIHIAWRCLT